jgi:tetratricopeptide (TPR) repeat protein
MFCIQCGSDNPDQAIFCRSCGRRFEKEDRPTGPLALSTNPDQVSIHNAPSPSEQLWPGAPSELAIEDTPTAISNTPLPEQYYLPSTGATLSAAAEVFYTPSVDIPSADTYPTFPPMAESTEAQLQIPGSSGTPPFGTPPAPRSSRFNALAKPLPRLVFAGAIVLVAAILVVLFFTGTDWAAGAMHVALGAGIIALLIASAVVVRSFAGMASRANPKRVIQFISANVAFLLLTLLFLAGFTQQATIHSLQAHSLEGQQQWQRAINEYQLAGERTPVSDNIARVYNEWGEQFAGQQRYQEAFVKFDMVLNAFGSPAAEVNRAQSGEINAYLGWAKQAMDTKSYSDATQRYDELLQKPYCQASCQNRVDMFDATAYYDLAEFQLGTQDYSGAVSNFGTVLSRFPNSPEATKLHGDYAQSLYGEGQQQLTSLCNTAIPTYQQLASQFADTPQGRQAAAALKAPQPVKGHFVGVVPHAGYLSDVAALMKGLYQNMPQNSFFNLLTVSPTTVINSDGSFTFKAIPQGTYDLAWGTNNTADGSQLYTSYFFQSNNSIVYAAKVGPLCAFDFGDIHEDIPSAP